MRPWILAETNYAYTQTNRYEVAVLPLGATEPHNLHLPYGTDTLEGDLVGREICSAAHQRGAKVVLLPTVPYGTQTNMRQLPLALNVNPSTLYRFVTDLIDSLAESGIHKILLLNSHGGNELKPLLRELSGKTPAHLFLCNWYKALTDEYHKIFAEPDDHAGEMETSIALAYFPDLVLRNDDGSLAADRGPHGADAVPRGERRLGLDHASLASADDQRRVREPSRRDRGKGPPPDASAGRPLGHVPGGTVRGQAGRAVSFLRGGGKSPAE